MKGERSYPEIEYKKSRAVGGGYELPISHEVRDKRRQARERQQKELEKRKVIEFGQYVEREVKVQKRTAGEYSILQAAALITGLVLLVFSVLSYVYQEASLTTSTRRAYTLRTEYEQLKAENDNREAAIVASVDTEEIYRIATQELGMAYPKKHQVIFYHQTESEYVTQYENIPKQ